MSGFVQRAKELEGRDPIVRYYCIPPCLYCLYRAQLHTLPGLYHAANTAMHLSPAQEDSRAFLLTLLDQLEALKADLAQHEAISNDIVGQAYVSNFADRVFAGADQEDRTGSATQSVD